MGSLDLTVWPHRSWPPQCLAWGAGCQQIPRWQQPCSHWHQVNSVQHIYPLQFVIFFVLFEDLGCDVGKWILMLIRMFVLYTLIKYIYVTFSLSGFLSGFISVTFCHFLPNTLLLLCHCSLPFLLTSCLIPLNWVFHVSHLQTSFWAWGLYHLSSLIPMLCDSLLDLDYLLDYPLGYLQTGIFNADNQIRVF